MVKNIKSLLLIIFSTILVSSCGSVQKALDPQNKNTSDEFLVEKKSPLVMPPDYNSLPKPKKKGEEIAQEEDFELKKILGEDTNTTKNDTSSNTDGDSLEKSILKKINVN